MACTSLFAGMALILAGIGPCLASDASLKDWRAFYDKGLNKVNPPLPRPCAPLPERPKPSGAQKK